MSDTTVAPEVPAVDGAVVSVDKPAVAPEGAAPAPSEGHVGEPSDVKGGTEGVVEPSVPPAAVARQPQWKAEKYDREVEKRRALEAEVAELRKQTEGKGPTLTQADVERLAAERQAAADFNRKANEIVEQGKAAFPDFMDKVGAIRQQVDQTDVKEQAAYVSLVAAAMETGEGARIIYELGANPDKATELLKLSQAGNGVKLGMEIAKMAAAKNDPEPSKAPKPMSLQVGGRGSSQEEIDPADAAKADKLSTDTWMKRRQAHVDAQRKAGVRMW